MHLRALKADIRTLDPSYFGLPMSTGAVALATHALGHDAVARVFFLLNNTEIAVLGFLLLARLIFFFPAFRKDLASHSKGAGFLTVVAALCILGAGHIELDHRTGAAILLWCMALPAWLALTYSFFILVTIKRRKPDLEHGIDGSWLLFVVSVQALSVLGCLIAPHVGWPMRNMLFVSLFFHLLGCLFYVVVIGMIFYRTTFFHMRADEFKPSYWIDMGAAAITALAGMMLADALARDGIYTAFIPLLELGSVFFWVAGTWWIPVILFLEVWRHTIIPLRYHAGQWSMVFPLGVYTLCTWELANALALPALQSVAWVFLRVAWLAWCVTFLGMAHRLWRRYGAMQEDPAATGTGRN